MCEVRHQIKLNNIKNNEVIHHELLLIKGAVVDKLCSTSKTESTEIQVKNLQENSIQSLKISRFGDFKILVQLHQGEKNQYELTYCNVSRKININFHPIETVYKIQEIYIRCKDETAVETDNIQYQKVEPLKIIQLNLKLIQCLFSEKLLEETGLRKTFTLKPNCLVFQSELTVEEVHRLDEHQLWNKFAYELINSPCGSDENLKFVAFIGCTKYEGFRIRDNDFSYENIKRHIKGHAALGGGGLALFSSACFYSWPSEFHQIIPCFKSIKKINLTEQFDESNYRRTYGGCYATSLGAVCHELGHCFDLGHTKDGIMGSGFDYINLVFTTDNKTEILPERVVEPVVESMKLQDQRLTKLKKKNFNEFLDKYHEQKLGDSTYFTTNCAIILSNHKWLNHKSSENNIEIQFNKEKYQVTSNDNIILIEIREKINSLVIKYFNYTKKELKTIDLPDTDLKFNNIFVLTLNGGTKLFEF